MNKDIEQVEGQKPYEAPRLTTISLRPEEAVLGHCKNASATGPAGSSCITILGPCGSVGS